MSTAQADITDIKAVIPSNASSSNKLVTAADVPAGGNTSIFDIMYQYKNTVSASTSYTRFLLWFKNFLDHDISDTELHIRIPASLVKTMGDIPTEFSTIDNDYLYLHFTRYMYDTSYVMYKGFWTYNDNGKIKFGTLSIYVRYDIPSTISSNDSVSYQYLNNSLNLTNRTV